MVYVRSARCKAWKDANPRRHHVHVKRANATRELRNRAIILQHLKQHPCIDCGETDPIVLEFDHRDRSSKKFDIAAARNKSFRSLMAEIAKCDIRCANCHRRKTWRESGGHWKSRKPDDLFGGELAYRTANERPAALRREPCQF